MYIRFCKPTWTSVGRYIRVMMVASYDSDATSTREGGVYYIVTLHLRRTVNRWLCTCPHWQLSLQLMPGHKTCKHIQLVQAAIEHVGGVNKLPYGEDVPIVREAQAANL